MVKESKWNTAGAWGTRPPGKKDKVTHSRATSNTWGQPKSRSKTTGGRLSVIPSVQEIQGQTKVEEVDNPLQPIWEEAMNKGLNPGVNEAVDGEEVDLALQMVAAEHGTQDLDLYQQFYTTKGCQTKVLDDAFDSPPHPTCISAEEANAAHDLEGRPADVKWETPDNYPDLEDNNLLLDVVVLNLKKLLVAPYIKGAIPKSTTHRKYWPTSDRSELEGVLEVWQSQDSLLTLNPAWPTKAMTPWAQSLFAILDEYNKPISSAKQHAKQLLLKQLEKNLKHNAADDLETQIAGDIGKNPVITQKKAWVSANNQQCLEMLAPIQSGYAIPGPSSSWAVGTLQIPIKQSTQPTISSPNLHSGSTVSTSTTSILSLQPTQTPSISSLSPPVKNPNAQKDYYKGEHLWR
ncbi:Helicase carboxy-terminal domain containing protein [Ceratobasidium theobromae]|uniref:Helicase carboxy-terminal domain containing protein n=1 Tax=Ceratobasidium theobromae TaxID=1582974 RepID=A0A5N5Q7E6_9AGAM|nr:Helicase carboxy-terminal domain containing protein [Ceratobasidium theobromae]